MTTKEKVDMAKSILASNGEQGASFGFIRADKGLIERTESSKIILTEDNKELLVD